MAASVERISLDRAGPWLVGGLEPRPSAFSPSKTPARMADLVIIAILLLGAIVGFRRGFVVPLVAQGRRCPSDGRRALRRSAGRSARAVRWRRPAHDRRKPSLHRMPR